MQQLGNKSSSQGQSLSRSQGCHESSLWGKSAREPSRPASFFCQPSTTRASAIHLHWTPARNLIPCINAIARPTETLVKNPRFALINPPFKVTSIRSCSLSASSQGSHRRANDDAWAGGWRFGPPGLNKYGPALPKEEVSPDNSTFANQGRYRVFPAASLPLTNFDPARRHFSLVILVPRYRQTRKNRPRDAILNTHRDGGQHDVTQRSCSPLHDSDYTKSPLAVPRTT